MPAKMTHRRALGSMHIAALMFGLTGIFGKLILAGPMVDRKSVV